MFKKNRSHEAPELFSVKNTLPENLQKRYEKSWAKSFYENVFCKIDETTFEILFSKNYSRPNTAINIYVSLEILKETFGLNDEELLDRFHFDNMFLFAMGLNNVGDKMISERAFYYMRSRVVEYEEETGINLFDLVFKDINDDYINELKISKKIKRLDSTLIGSNIRRLNRIKLLVEVLKVFLKELDEDKLMKLSEEIKRFKGINTENYVFQLSSDESKIKIKEIAEYLYKIKVLFENDNEVKNIDSYKMLERVIDDQLNIDINNNKIELKEQKEIKSNSLQSPYDPDCTYKNKGTQAKQGYSASAAETCDKDNKVQIITDIIVEDNNIDDSKILEDNFEEIMDDETEELITDGAYLNDGVKKKIESNKKEIITTAIRGKKPKKDKVSSVDFEIKNNEIIKCPRGMKPTTQEVIGDKIVARFSHESCDGCKLNCIIKRNKRKDHLLELEKLKILSDQHRHKFKDKEYIEKCRLRPAIEGTMFQLKLHLRNGKSRFRRKIKIRNRTILRAIGINFKRVYGYRLEELAIQFFIRIILQIKQIVSGIRKVRCNFI